MTATVSIITINLNQAAGLKRTLNSVRQQINKPFELIVIDGKSNDESVEVIRSNEDIISYWVSEKDNGIYAAMNKGWKKASGTYCLFLNAGDHLHDDNVLKASIAFLEEQGGDIVYGDMAGHKDGKMEINRFDQPVSLYYFYSWYLPHPASFIKRSLLEKLGGYYENYKVIADWAFMVKALLGNAVFVHLPMVVSDFYADGISSSGHSERALILEKEFAFLKNDFAQFKRFRYLENSRFIKKAIAVKKLFDRSLKRI